MSGQPGLAHSIWYILTVWVVGRLGKRMWTSKTGIITAVVYAFSPVPFIASNIVTPDTPLSFWITAAMYFFWRATHTEKGERCWIWTIAWGMSLGMACLAKGPAALIFLAPMLAYLAFSRSLWRFVYSWSFLLALLLFISIGGSWYATIFWMIPGAFPYVIDNQVIGRLFSDRYNRNPGFLAPFYVYLPILMVGMIPWAVVWWPIMRSRWIQHRSKRERNPFRMEDRSLFLALWIGLPLLVFCLA
jgi:4-amino-4-deoxy-L-arabinose transferase-like glycosyltransferase